MEVAHHSDGDSQLRVKNQLLLDDLQEPIRANRDDRAVIAGLGGEIRRNHAVMNSLIHSRGAVSIAALLRGNRCDSR